MINEERLINEFLELVKIDSPSGKEGRLAQVLIEKLSTLGLKVSVDDAGEKVGGETGNVIARLKGKPGAPAILFSCHMDNVMPCEGVKPVIKDGVIYSDGTTVLGADNKAGIAAVLEALRVVKENSIDHGDVEVVFSIWEEGGLRGASNLNADLLTAKYAFVLDSGGSPGEIITSGPAQDKIEVKLIGRAAHAGVAPEEGISAIMMAARAIDRMKLLRIDEETTANIGVINGGQATNIVTPEVTVKAEARSLSEEKLSAQTRHMVEAFEKAAAEFGGRAEIEVTRMYPPFRVEESDDIVRGVKRALERIGITGYTRSTGGGSDTNIFNGMRIKAVNLGIGERKPHTLEEHIHIKDLVDTARMVIEIIRVFAEM
ncbi:M20/M25/M40 family metallo-hydrolase [Thermosediminibacter litoriperuensis]|uniref:Tripeptide aminopeptidase n=1 Tax=Thermosediminibacter litoriperuensis TaxID=291989 RepID=A0A5S5ARR5_9FIRM|nr:M20/M25/M40 family metallo-hydrolase [Thermosediminibacter litoriperuensis]TYP54208.1 tripeptide aminopeptidase [Thermosediminibacter litoriperuensis]